MNLNYKSSIHKKVFVLIEECIAQVGFFPISLLIEKLPKIYCTSVWRTDVAVAYLVEVALHLAKIEFFHKLEQIIQLQYQNVLQVAARDAASSCNGVDELSRAQKDPMRHSLRNNLDLVIECDFLFRKFCGDWILDEYFVDHNDDYLVSFLC